MYIYGDGTHRQQIVTHPNLLPIKVFQCYILDTVVVDCVVYGTKLTSADVTFYLALYNCTQR